VCVCVRDTSVGIELGYGLVIDSVRKLLDIPSYMYVHKTCVYIMPYTSCIILSVMH
jgi:hypothetical protein